MSQRSRSGARRAATPPARLAKLVILLSACVAAASCSPSHGEEIPPAQEGIGEGRSAAERAVAYWVERWRAPHDEPMYLRLPVGVDTRDWELMSRGQSQWLREQKSDRPPAKHYAGDYEFTWNAFTWNIPLWERVLEPWVGRPGLQYLEIGVAEGRSLLWMLENVLTHPTSRATGIDPFLVEGHEQRLRQNLRRLATPEKAEVIVGFSQDVLPKLEPASYDLIYVDGSHLAGDVLFDAVITWRLLKEGGLVIHDDYMWQYRKRQPPDLLPLLAIDAFITAHRNTAEVLHRGLQVVLRKRALELPAFCWNRDPCLRIGRYLYAWNSNRLLEIGSGEKILLTEREQSVLKEILRARRIGAEAELVLEEDVRELRTRHPAEFERLSALLELRLAAPQQPRKRARPEGSPAAP